MTTEAGRGQNGTAVIRTSHATAIGYEPSTHITQHACGSDGFLAVATLDADELNRGFGFANSGFNSAVANASMNTSGIIQGALGQVAFNDTCGCGNRSHGSAHISTGSATGIGNLAFTRVRQPG